MGHGEHRQRQRGVLDAVVTVLKSEPQVLGMVVAGSHARGEQDAFSDIDVACFFRDEKRTGRPELYERVGSIAPLLCKLWLYDKHALYLFENGVRLDLDFLRASDVSARAFDFPDRQILFDPDGALARSLPAPRVPKTAQHPEWFQPGDDALVGWFFWMLRQAVCWAMRGGQGGDRAFDKLSAAVDSLAHVRTRLVEMRLWTLGAQDYLGRADPDCARRLSRTYPRLQADEVIICAELLLDEYERVIVPYCAKAGVEYSAHRAERMRALITEFAQIQP